MKATTKTILTALSNADQGEIHGLSLSPELYPAESVGAATTAFSDYCRVERKMEEDGTLSLTLSIHPAGKVESRHVIGEFLNFLLNHAISIRWQAGVER